MDIKKIKTMKLLKVLAIILVSLIIIVIIFLGYIGFFTKIEIVEKETGGYVTAGSDFTGEYSKVYITMQEVDTKLKNIGIICTKGFGVYYDDPKVTQKDKCHSYVGNIIENPTPEIISKINEIGLKVDTIPVKPSMIIEFPVRSTLSYMVGPAKAYPAFNNYFKEKQLLPSLSVEIYDVPAKKTLYIMQYEKSNQ